MKRYSIRAWMHGSDHEVEIVQVDNNPKAMAEALAAKTLDSQNGLGKKVRIPKYNDIRIVDLEAGS